jgi:hypothetical protein
MGSRATSVRQYLKRVLIGSANVSVRVKLLELFRKAFDGIDPDKFRGTLEHHACR